MLVAACAADSLYVSPTGASTAALTIEIPYADPFPAYTFRDSQNCEGRLTVQESIRAGVPAKIKVQANEPFTVGIAAQRGIQDKSRMRGLTTCYAVVTFVPSAGRQYVARYQWPGDFCTFTVFEQVAAPDGHLRSVPENTQRLRNEMSCKQ
jgi:hypothetical protein